MHVPHVVMLPARALAQVILGRPGIPESMSFGDSIMHVVSLPAMVVAGIAGVVRVTMPVASMAGVLFRTRM